MPGPLEAKAQKIVTLLVASLLAALGLVSLARQPGLTVPDDGAEWADFTGNVVLVDIRPGGPAALAGLQVGDILRAIDGKTVASAIGAENRLWSLPGGQAGSYRIERDGRPMELGLTPARTGGPGHPLAPFLAVVGFFFLTTGAYVTWRLPRSRLTFPHALLSLSLFAVLALSDTPRAETIDWVLFWMDRAGRILAPAAFLHFVLAFLKRDGERRSRALLAAVYTPSIVLGATSLLLVAAGRAASAQSPADVLRIQDRVELGWMALSFLGGAALLARAYLNRSSRAVHRQVRWMVWGAIGGLVPFALASALLHYRLSDLELFIKRGVATISVVFFTLAVYDLVWTLAGRLLPPAIDPQGFMAAGLAALATALLFSQLKTFTLSLVDRIFYRGRYNFRRTLLSFGRELNSELNLDALLSKIERRVSETMALDRLAVYLADGAGALQRAGRGGTGPARLVADQELIDRLRGVSYLGLEDLAAGSEAGRALGEAGLHTLFPMRVKGEVRALLAAGTRATGDPLNSEDVEMIVALCGQAASAIEAARLLRQLSEKVSEVEKLRRAHENILESSQVAILVVDDEGTVRNLNRASEELTGVPREEALGSRLREVYSLPLVRSVEQLMDRARDEAPAGPLRTYRSSITNRAGARLRVNVTLSRLEDTVGPAAAGPAVVNGSRDLRPAPGTAEGAAWVVTLDDVTEQVRMEETLLRQDRLAAVGLLASGVAHEVNTPLTGISSYAQMLLEETPPSDPRHELLRKIEKQTARASAIANGLLNFSRGNGEESFDRLDAREMVEEALTLVEPQLRGLEIRLERDIAPDLPPLSGHRGKLQQVVLNLLLNARDALEGKGTIRVSLKASRERLVLLVADDGCGINEDDLGKIFDPFFTTKSPGKGTGLGLALSWNIVKEHRGDITVESRRGEGTTFQVELPLERRASASG
jgi:PAS domain S-box-containing protein